MFNRTFSLGATPTSEYYAARGRAFTAVSTGNLPKIINQVRKAQFQLIMESKASNWPKAMRLPKIS